MGKKPDHVYLGTDGREFKVGVTSNIRARMSAINYRTDRIELVRFWYVGPIARNVERLAHDALGKIDAGPACRQEWFRVSVEQAIAAVEKAIEDAPNVTIPKKRFRPAFTEKCADELLRLSREFRDN